MSQAGQKFFVALLLSDAPFLQKKALLLLASNEQILTLREIFLNVLKGNVSQSPILRAKLKKYFPLLRSVVLSNASLKGSLNKKAKSLLNVLSLIKHRILNKFTK
mgnify:CR=1 FL=1